MSTVAKNLKPEAVPGTAYTFDDLMHPSGHIGTDLSTRVAWASEDLKARITAMLETQRGRNRLLMAVAALGFGVGILFGVWRPHA